MMALLRQGIGKKVEKVQAAPKNEKNEAPKNEKNETVQRRERPKSSAAGAGR